MLAFGRTLIYVVEVEVEVVLSWNFTTESIFTSDVYTFGVS